MLYAELEHSLSSFVGRTEQIIFVRNGRMALGDNDPNAADALVRTTTDRGVPRAQIAAGEADLRSQVKNTGCRLSARIGKPQDCLLASGDGTAGPDDPFNLA